MPSGCFVSPKRHGCTAKSGAEGSRDQKKPWGISKDMYVSLRCGPGLHEGMVTEEVKLTFCMKSLSLQDISFGLVNQNVYLELLIVLTAEYFTDNDLVMPFMSPSLHAGNV